MPKVLITGITGFIGARVAEVLLKNNIEIVGLKRSKSNIWRCKDFEDKISWINLDGDPDWKQLAYVSNPELVIHCAWIGVEARDRDNYAEQAKNIDFLLDLIKFCEKAKVEKFIFLGSQAEYGIIEGKVAEDYPTNPTSAYGAIKLASLQILRTFCINKNIKWYWLRVFSLFGEKEGKNWLIPSMIENMQNSDQMNFTAAEQSYAYLYIEDFANIIYQLVKRNVDSGIYNISSNQPYELKAVIKKIRNIVNKKFVLNFGAIPYRASQSMHIEGDIAKLEKQIGKIPFTDFDIALQNTINYYTLR